MLNFKSALVILAVSCISAALSQNRLNVTAKDILKVPGDDMIIVLPKEGILKIKNGSNPRGRNIISPAKRTRRPFITKSPKTPKPKYFHFETWPSGIVPFIIQGNLSYTMRRLIRIAMKEIERDVNVAGFVCVKFVLRERNETNYLGIISGSGCYAHVGMINRGQQNLSLGENCESKTVVMHELLHVLGFSHEHVRHDRDRYITINMSNVVQERKMNFKKWKTSDRKDAMNTSYDFGSIMHYDPYTLAVNREVPVITLKPGLDKDIVFGERMVLSKTDVIRVQRRYGCKEGTWHIDRFSADTLFSCKFSKGMCGFTNTTDTTANVAWRLMTGPSRAGPVAGHSNGADAYLIAETISRKGTAGVRTPRLKAEAICATFYIFQKGPRSHLRVLLSGKFGRIIVKEYVNDSRNEWSGKQISLVGSFLSDFRMEFEAKLSYGDVAIDDIYIQKGECP